MLRSLSRILLRVFLWTPFLYSVCAQYIRTPDLGSILRAHGMDCRILSLLAVQEPVNVSRVIQKPVLK